MTSNNHKSATDFASGILSYPQLESAYKDGVITALTPLAPRQIQPASIDLRLGAKAWRVQGSFLPGKGNQVADKLNALALHEIDLSHGAVLEKGCVYIAEIMEGLNLPQEITAIANPKSSTGRLDVFTRMIVDGATEFEIAKGGYHGVIYLEISPRTFPVLVHKGSRLSQLRLRIGETCIDKRISLSVDLSGKAQPLIPKLIGWRARKYTGLIDIDQVAAYPVAPFWEKITTDDLSAGGLVLNPDEFYIIASREDVVIPNSQAAEMTAYDTSQGEFRAHYAGFFDPGFGMAELGAEGTRAVLEMRSHDVPFLIEEGQTVCHLVYENLSLCASDALYGEKGSGSHYQAQGLQLAKHFKPPVREVDYD